MPRKSGWQKTREFIANDSLSIALFGLFVAALAGQAVTGWFAWNASLRAGHFPEIPFQAWLATGQFLDGLFTNWQAAILQLAVLIAFSSVLRQKGAAHSRKPGKSGKPGKSAKLNHRRMKWKFGRRDSAGEWLHANSLGLAFFGLFIVAFMLHTVCGTWKYNEHQALRHLPEISWSAYVHSADFWESVFETWEAEFAVIGIYIVASIFLRQESSPESKRVAASDSQTGDTNE